MWNVLIFRFKLQKKSVFVLLYTLLKWFLFLFLFLFLLLLQLCKTIISAKPLLFFSFFLFFFIISFLMWWRILFIPSPLKLSPPTFRYKSTEIYIPLEISSFYKLNYIYLKSHTAQIIWSFSSQKLIIIFKIENFLLYFECKVFFY